MTFSAPGPLVLPTRVASYELTRLIGRGAIGTVYEGTDVNSGTPVAVKLLHGHLAQDPLFRTRLEQAAELAARLTSPYTARLFDYGEAAGHYYLAGQLVQGQTVRELLSAGRVSLSRSLDIARQVALALEEAESKGLVHGDVRPGNIYLTPDGRVRVLDFGLTRRLQEGILTVAQDFGGTQRYAAPETFSTAVTHRSDIYSLGAVLFHLLTGRAPFDGRTLSDLIRQHERAALPLELLAGYPDAVAGMVMHCLEKDPARRYQTASELVVALEYAGRAAALESERRGSVTVVDAPAASTAREDSVTISRIGPAGGSPEERTLRIDAALRIGSAPDNDLALSDDRTVSGHHALVRRSGSSYVLEDLSSRNGTFIERAGVIIRVNAPTPLLPGDTVRLGNTKLVLTSGGTRTAVAPLRSPAATEVAREVARDEAPSPPPATSAAPPKEGGRLRVAMIALVLLAIIVAVMVAVWLFAFRADDGDAAERRDAMVPIPGGIFIRGATSISEPGEELSFPAHQVTLESFEIDRYEVTNGEYARFLGRHPGEYLVPSSDDDAALPYVWREGTFPRGTASHPAVLVTWDEARAYCADRGKRLPTEVEWERAARSDDGRKWPWGNEFDASLLNWSGTRHPDDTRTMPVGSYPDGASPYGALDMAGNVWEWTEDDIGPYPGSGITDVPSGKASRGGAWDSAESGTSTYIRNHDPAGSRLPTVGFRCARSLRDGNPTAE